MIGTTNVITEDFFEKIAFEQRPRLSVGVTPLLCG